MGNIDELLSQRRSDLQPQDLVLTMVGTYLHPRSRRLWSGGLVNLLNEFGYSAGAARIALTRLVNRELFERARIGRLSFYRLTSRSLKLLKEGDARIFSLDKAPPPTDRWTVVWHAVPEERRLERGRLARRLRFLGFGSLQDGTWVSPHDRESEAVSVIEDLEIEPYCSVLIGTPAESLDFRGFVSRMWPQDELSARYHSFATEFKPFSHRNRLSDQEAFRVRTLAVHVFREFPSLDPQLPDDSMAAPQLRAAALDVFLRIYEQLAEPAKRYFDNAVKGPDAERPELTTQRPEISSLT